MRLFLGMLLVGAIAGCGHNHDDAAPATDGHNHATGTEVEPGPPGPPGPPGKDGTQPTLDASINSISPTSLPGARTSVITISGFGTHFKAGTTTVDFGDPGIKTTKVDVASATYLRATLDVTTAATFGPHNLTVTTPGAGQQGVDEKAILEGVVSVDATIYSEPLGTGAAAPSVQQGGMVDVQFRNSDYRLNPFDLQYVRPQVGISALFGLAMPAPPVVIDSTMYGSAVLVDALAPVGGLQVQLASRSPLGQSIQYISDPKDPAAPQIVARTPIVINFAMGLDNNTIAGNKQTTLYKMTSTADNYVAHVNLNTLGVPLRGGLVGAPRIVGAQAPSSGRFSEGLPFDTSPTVTVGTIDARNSLIYLPKAGDHFFALYTDNLTGSSAHSYKILVKVAAGAATDLKEPMTPDAPATPIATLTLDKPYYSVNAAIDGATDADYVQIKASKSGRGYVAVSTSSGIRVTTGIYARDCATLAGSVAARTGQGAASYEAALVAGSTYCVKVTASAKTAYQLVVSQDLP